MGHRPSGHRAWRRTPSRGWEWGIVQVGIVQVAEDSCDLRVSRLEQCVRHRQCAIAVPTIAHSRVMVQVGIERIFYKNMHSSDKRQDANNFLFNSP